MDGNGAERLNALAERLEGLLSGAAEPWADPAESLPALTALPPETERRDSLAEAQAEALAEALRQVTIRLDGEAVGRLVAPAVDAELGAAALGRRFG